MRLTCPATLSMNVSEHSTFNIERPTSNVGPNGNRWMFDVGCWVVNVFHCFRFMASIRVQILEVLPSHEPLDGCPPFRASGAGKHAEAWTPGAGKFTASRRGQKIHFFTKNSWTKNERTVTPFTSYAITAERL